MEIKAKHLLLFLFFILPFSIIAQNINQTPKNKKDGLYIENDGLNEVYYCNNQKNGIFKSYSRKNGKLAAFGYYLNDRKSGVWYYFNEESILIMKEYDIQKNTISVKQDDQQMITPDYKSNVIMYYPNGKKQEEGLVLYNDIEIDYIKIGNWKYYDDEGSLTDTVFYQYE